MRNVRRRPVMELRSDKLSLLKNFLSAYPSLNKPRIKYFFIELS